MWPIAVLGRPDGICQRIWFDWNRLFECFGTRRRNERPKKNPLESRQTPKSPLDIRIPTSTSLGEQLTPGSHLISHSTPLQSASPNVENIQINFELPRINKVRQRGNFVVSFIRGFFSAVNSMALSHCTGIESNSNRMELLLEAFKNFPTDCYFVWNDCLIVQLKSLRHYWNFCVLFRPDVAHHTPKPTCSSAALDNLC